MQGASGMIEYPKLRERQEVSSLTPENVDEITQWEKEVNSIIHSSQCPDVIRAKICQRCSYYDFCYSSFSFTDILYK